MSENKKHAETVQGSIEHILGVKTALRRRKRTETDIKKEQFTVFMNLMEQIETRAALMEIEIGLDFSKYDANFLATIELLIDMQFGSHAVDLIAFYLNERINPDGSVNDMLLPNGEYYQLNNPEDLYELITNLNKYFGEVKKS